MFRESYFSRFRTSICGKPERAFGGGRGGGQEGENHLRGVEEDTMQGRWNNTHDDSEGMGAPEQCAPKNPLHKRR